MPRSPSVEESVSPAAWIIGFLIGMMVLILFLGPPCSPDFKPPRAPMEVIEEP